MSVPPPTRTVVDIETGETTEIPLTPGEIAVHDELAGAAANEARATVFEADADTERLRIINERARTDPAYAALAELVLRGRTV